MISLDDIHIRKMILADAKEVLEWENNPENWEVSFNHSPYELEDIENLVIESRDLGEAKQQRYIIVFEDKAVGAVDLFAINFEAKVAGVGILIANKGLRNKGIAFRALELLEAVAFRLSIEYLECSVQINNEASIRLFNKLLYKKVNKSQLKIEHGGDDEDFYYFQKCLKK